MARAARGRVRERALEEMGLDAHCAAETLRRTQVGDDVESSRTPAVPRRLSLSLARTLFPLNYTEELGRSDPSRSTSTLTRIPRSQEPPLDSGLPSRSTGQASNARLPAGAPTPGVYFHFSSTGLRPRRPRIGPARATRRGRRRDKAGRPAPRLRPRACAPAACRARGDARPARRGRAEARRSGADGSATKGSQST
jgi:hypothetical protein